MISSTTLRCSISSRMRRAVAEELPEECRCIFSVRPAMMLSSAVMPLNSATFWNVRAMPCDAASWGRIRWRVAPLKVMRPCCG